MKKILLTLLLLILFIPGVNAETVKTYLIKDGVEQTDFTGGGVFEVLDGTGNGAMEVKDGYINFYTALWVQWTYKFNNAFDFTKYKTLNIEFAFPSSNNYVDSQYIAANFYFINSSTEHVYLSGKTTERTTYSYSISENITQDNLRLGFANLSNSNYKNYPLSIYNLWFESEKIEEEPKPNIQPDTTLVNFYTLCINKLVELSNFTTENKFTLFAFAIVIFFTIIGLFIHLFKGGRRQ